MKYLGSDHSLPPAGTGCLCAVAGSRQLASAGLQLLEKVAMEAALERSVFNGGDGDEDVHALVPFL